MIFRGGSLTGKATKEEAFSRYQEWLEEESDGPKFWTGKGVGLAVIDGEWTIETASVHCHDTNKLEDPPFMYSLGSGAWWIGGWYR